MTGSRHPSRPKIMKSSPIIIKTISMLNSPIDKNNNEKYGQKQVVRS
jgi:hypothetical protein